MMRGSVDERLQPGDRVRLAGTVAYERNGFVTVTWDNGTRSTVWRADLSECDTGIDTDARTEEAA